MMFAIGAALSASRSVSHRSRSTCRRRRCPSPRRSCSPSPFCTAAFWAPRRVRLCGRRGRCLHPLPARTRPTRRLRADGRAREPVLPQQRRAERLIPCRSRASRSPQAGVGSRRRPGAESGGSSMTDDPATLAGFGAFLDALRAALAARAGGDAARDAAWRRVDAALAAPPRTLRDRIPCAPTRLRAPRASIAGLADAERTCGASARPSQPRFAPRLGRPERAAGDAGTERRLCRRDLGRPARPRAERRRRDRRLADGAEHHLSRSPAPAEEIYIALSPGEWRRRQRPWHEPGIGGLVFNRPASFMRCARARRRSSRSGACRCRKPLCKREPWSEPWKVDVCAAQCATPLMANPQQWHLLLRDLPAGRLGAAAPLCRCAIRGLPLHPRPAGRLRVLAGRHS